MSRSRLGLLAALALAGAALIPATALGGGHAAAGNTVTLRNLRFHPGELTINRGDTVRWVWEDRGVEHNVTFNGFHSRTQTSGSYSVRFMRQGTFSYRCTIHVAEGMRGKIIVR